MGQDEEIAKQIPSFKSNSMQGFMRILQSDPIPSFKPSNFSPIFEPLRTGVKKEQKSEKVGEDLGELGAVLRHLTTRLDEKEREISEAIEEI